MRTTPKNESSPAIVALPTVPEDASTDEVLHAVITRLDSVAKVLQAEFNWLKPIIELSRQFDDEAIADSLKRGYIDEDEAAEKSGEDTPILIRAQVDTHLRNLGLSSKILVDIAASLNALKGVAASSTPLPAEATDNLSTASRGSRTCACTREEEV